MNLHPIAIVRSPVRDRKAMPPLGVPARVELLPEYAGGLLHLGKHSHLWVLAWLDRAERDVLQVTPRGVLDQGPGGLHGVFAVRSPVRPNPIGLTATRIVGVQGLSITVDPLDFLDGTPVIDLKPYFVSRDLIFTANNAQIGQPASTETMRKSLLHQAVNFHGELCVNLALAVRILEHFRSEVLRMIEPAGWKVTAPLGRPCLLDAVMGMTRVSPGRGSLGFTQCDWVRIECKGETYTYELRPIAGSAEQTLESPGDELFRFTPPQS